MKKRLIFSLIAIFALVFGQIGGLSHVVYAASIDAPITEVTPPVTRESLPRPGMESDSNIATLGVVATPNFSTLAISSDFITEPTTLSLTLEVSDPLDVTYFAAYYLGSDESYLDVMFHYDESLGLFVGDVVIDEHARSQVFNLAVVYIERGTTYELFFDPSVYPDYGETAADLSAAQFEYLNPLTESDPPVVDVSQLITTPAVVNSGESVHISVPISDASEVFAFIDFLGGHGGKDGYYSVELLFNPETNLYEADLPIPTFEKSQLFTAWSLYVTDFYNNELYLSDLDTGFEGTLVELGGADFTVVNSAVDTIPPVIDITTLRVEPNLDWGTIDLIVSASDAESGIRNGEAIFDTENGPLTLHGEYFGDEFHFMFPVNSYTRSQVFTLSSLTVYDNYENVTTLVSPETDLSAGNYTHVESPNLLSFALTDLMYFDANQNGEQDANEFDIAHHFDFLVLANSENPDEFYHLVSDGGYDPMTGNPLYNGNVLVVDIPSGTYTLMVSDMKGSPTQALSNGEVTISGEMGAQTYTINHKLGVYQNGMAVEANVIFDDTNGNGVFDSDELLRQPFYGNGGKGASEEWTPPYYENLFVQASDGTLYGFTSQGKPGYDGAAILYDLETFENVHLAHGTYTIITTNQNEWISTPTTFTIDASNEHLMTFSIAEIGLAPIATKNLAPTLTGLNEISIIAGNPIDLLSGVSANDPEDGVLTFSIIESFNFAVPGHYTLTYSTTDSDGLTTSATRIVHVQVGLGGLLVDGQKLLLDGKVVLDLSSLTASAFAQLLAGDELILSQGTLRNSVDGLLITNSDYRYVLQGTTITIQKLDMASDEYVNVSTLDLASGVLKDTAGKTLATWQNLAVNANGQFVYTIKTVTTTGTPTTTTKTPLPNTGDNQEASLLGLGLISSAIGVLCFWRKRSS